MKISIIPVPVLKDNYVWTIHNQDNHSVLVVDPGVSEPVAAFLKQNNFKLKGILLTHHHWDHTNGVKDLKKWYDVPTFAPAAEKISETTQAVVDGDIIQIADFPHFKVIAIPGHTLGHSAYFAPDILFSGDTLFAAGCGRLFEGTAKQMYTSLQKLSALPSTTKVYCGHEYTLNNLHFAKTVEPNNSKIDERIAHVTEIRNKNLPSLPALMADEKETNPFLRCDSLELIRNVENHAQIRLSDPVDVFSQLRKWKDSF